METQCYICGRNAEIGSPSSGRDAYIVGCDLCGEFEVSRTLAVNLRNEAKERLPYLTAYTRQTWESGRRANLNTTNWRGFAEVHQHTSVHQKAEKLLRLFEKRTQYLGEYVTVNAGLDYPLIDGTNAEAMYFFLEHATELRYLERKKADTCRLTVGGWGHLDPSSGGAGIPGRVFIAMSFDEPLDAAYEGGIKPAIEQDCGMTPIRVDRVYHEEKICDKILAEIRRCQLVVADFTNNRPGVYFEAGFALALGRRVVWTCREDHIGQLHFDTRQYPHLVWKEPRDLRVRLAERIQALMSV